MWNRLYLLHMTVTTPIHEGQSLTLTLNLVGTLARNSENRRRLCGYDQFTRLHSCMDSFMISQNAPRFSQPVSPARYRFQHAERRRLAEKLFSQQDTYQSLVLMFAFSANRPATGFLYNRQSGPLICLRVFGSTTLVTWVSLTDMRNINNPAPCKPNASCCCPTKATCFIRDTLLFVRAPSDVSSFLLTAISNENRELSHTTPEIATRTPEALPR